MRGHVLGTVIVVTAVSLAGAASALAQQGGADVIRRGLAHRGARPPAGFYRFVASHPGAFEFKHGWLARARQVRRNRQALRAAGAWRQLNQRMAVTAPAASATAVSGALRYPTFLPLFSNTVAADSALQNPSAVASEFWGTTAAPPYSITTYYQEISGGRLTVTGTVLPPIRVSQTDTFYSGGSACQGFCGGGVPTLIEELLRHADSTVNFADYADSATGYVPAIVILDPQVGGECYLVYDPAANSIWAHRFSLSGWGVGPYVTHDSINGVPVKVDDYIIQGGQGGSGGCTPGQLAPIGTVTHETGHLFGLPDLYDVTYQTEGIGQWDLMSEGNELTPTRPAHMSAWTLSQMGWIAEVPLTASQTVTASPIEIGDTAYVVPLGAATPDEMFVVENRQPIGSDSMMHGPGLMIYHLDTLLMRERGLDAPYPYTNTVNAGLPHALAVEEAAGDTGLNCTWPAACNDRGDAGDPFPGTSGNTAFGPSTTPAARTNEGAPAGIRIDSIQQLAPFGAMRFRLTVGGITMVAASDTTASVIVDGVRTDVFRGIFADGSTHTIAMDSAQTSANGRVRYLFASWSDGLARQHTITGASAGASYTADVIHRYLFQITVLGGGSVSATRTIDPAGSFLAEGDSVTLTPVPAVGSAFVGWSVDTVTGAHVLALKAVRPYSLVATFAGTADVVRQLLTDRSSLTAGQLVVLDGLGNNNRQFDVGDFVAWLDRNAGVLSAPPAAVRGRVRR